ncbi:glycosyl transferase [Microbacterium sp. p3-SID336]|uniref:glycosyl transferase n=1 Tax=Microbacterium sp. p3-SID336 TaxID=2916212 RepID=UPI0021A2BB8C|nr:glycosyl transferase [Microbacterium sp. p3-SID336]MCT1477085.1 glycosyl transferase [Microbacterium sp. p3-SID336]
MRFVWAVVAFVLAAVLIGAGIAQRTVFVGPSAQKEQVEIEEPAPFVLMDGDVLRTNPGSQTLRIEGDGEIFASYGRTADMQAWLADSDYNHVSVGDDGEFVVQHRSAPEEDEAGEPSEGAATPTPDPTASAEEPAEDTPGRNPVGSDLWLDSFSAENLLISDNMQLPEGTSVLIAYDGTKDAPDDIVVSWPLDNSTPLAGPLMVAGGLVLAVGLILYVLAIRHQRRGRGPRRKGPGPLPTTQPIDVAALPPAERAAIESPSDARTPSTDAGVEDAEVVDEGTEKEHRGEEGKSSMRARRASRRRMLALPALGLTALLAAGCTADSWPQLGDASASPSPSPTVIAPENQKPPAVTESQASRILKSVSDTLVEADTALDIDLASTRLAGAALETRTTDYALRATLTDRPLPAVIPTDDVQVLLPEATDRWPRTVLMLTQNEGDETVPPVLLTMTQADPWSNYKVTNIAEMAADAVFPEVAASWLGTAMVPSDSAFLSLPPDQVAAAFADVVDAGEKSQYYGQFDELALAVAKSLTDQRQGVVQNIADAGAAETALTAFDAVPTAAPPVSMTTLDSGAIVAVSVLDVGTVTAANSDVVIRFGDNAEAKALTGVTESPKGVETTYELQLFFAVPSQGSTEPIRLLASHQDLLSVKVLK